MVADVMDKAELARIVAAAKCRVVGHEDASNDGHRLTLARLVQAFDRSESSLLCEPSLARRTTRPPDVVLIDPEIGVHVFEVKGIALDQIEGLEAGGQVLIRYATGVRPRNPIAQVRNAMFDIKDATARAYRGEGDLRLPFKYWVVFPTIGRKAWGRRFGPEGFCPAEFLFADDLDPPARLARRLGAPVERAPGGPIELCPLDQLQCDLKAFGDTSVLYATPEERSPRRTDEGTLGEQFDGAAELAVAGAERARGALVRDDAVFPQHPADRRGEPQRAVRHLRRRGNGGGRGGGGVGIGVGGADTGIWGPDGAGAEGAGRDGRRGAPAREVRAARGGAAAVHAGRRCGARDRGDHRPPAVAAGGTAGPRRGR